ncbi:MAG: thiamine pyrophosphate-dependent dehydrogenase E1 component subunit alpha [Syntrophobacter sp.]
MGIDTKAISPSTKIDKEMLLTLYRNLVRSRSFDQCFARRIQAGELIGFYHEGAGAYAPPVGVCSFLRKDDILWPHHRPHGIPHMLSKGIDLKYYLAEHTGKQTGCCAGRATFHFSFPEDGVFGFSGVVGAGFPQTVGWGLACKMNKRGQIVVNAFGDGGVNRGTAHECMLMCANWKLPVVFLVENNGLAIHSRVEDMMPTENIADWAKGYNVPAVIVDGQDVIAVAEAAIDAIEYARSGKGPYMVEAKTVRLTAHTAGFHDMAGYAPRTPEEIEELRKRDPIMICQERLLAEGILTQESIDQIKETSAKEVADAEAYADGCAIADQLDLSDISKLIYAQ